MAPSKGKAKGKSATTKGKKPEGKGRGTTYKKKEATEEETQDPSELRQQALNKTIENTRNMLKNLTEDESRNASRDCLEALLITSKAELEALKPVADRLRGAEQRVRN